MDDFAGARSRHAQQFTSDIVGGIELRLGVVVAALAARGPGDREFLVLVGGEGLTGHCCSWFLR